MKNEISMEVVLARYELSKEIISIIGCPKSSSEYIDKVQAVSDRLFEIQEEYHKYLTGE